MSLEKYCKFYENCGKGITLRAGGKAASFSFSLSPRADKKYRLFACGETGLFYQWKNEPDYPMQYRLISDALDNGEAELLVNGNAHRVILPFGVMIKATVKDGLCAFPHSEEGEVISIEKGVFRLQGTGV